MGLLRFSISSWFSFGKLYFLRICPFLPSCPFYWHIVADSSLLWSFVFLCCLLWSPFTFLILWIWFFSLCFLMSLANGLSILFVLSKNQLLALLIFAMVSFVSFVFISALIFKISFLLLTLGCLIYSFSSCFCVELGYLFDFPPVSWGRLVLLWTLPLALLLLNPIDFGFSFSFISMHILISSVICWFFRSVLFSHHMFVFY